MNEFRFEYEWEDPAGARGEELRETWAHLKIWVGDRAVTRVEDRGNVRNGIYLPLYPIAEWIAANWWSLLYESPSLRSEESGEYWHRHNLRFASEGYAFPDFAILPEGKRIVLKWWPSSRPECRVEFLEKEGQLVLERENVEQVLGHFLQGVSDRLHDRGVGNTYFAQDWKAITEAGKDERDFCMAVGRLGCDPYSPKVDDYADVLIGLASSIPASAVEEYLLVAECSNLADQGALLKEFIAHAKTADLDLGSVREIRAKLAPSRGQMENTHAASVAPWEQGYRLARDLRSCLGLDLSKAVKSSGELGSVLGVTLDDWAVATSQDLRALSHVEGAMASSRDEFPIFAVRDRIDSGKVFSLCRGLCEYLGSSHMDAAVITDAKSERQKRNRAFAAEFLAPAAGIKAFAGNCGYIAAEQVAMIAEHFGVWELVVRMQIHNQRIARLADATEF